MPRPKRINQDIDSLIGWIHDRYRIVVEFDLKSHGGEFSPDEKVISLNSRTPKKYQLYTLLHEIGHAMLCKNFKDFTFHFPYSCYEGNWGKKHEIDVVREEVLAWENGWNIAKRRKIKINRKEYYQFARTSIYSYFQWIVDNNLIKLKRKEKRRKRLLQSYHLNPIL